ncbi:MAG: hypothetical protein HYS24_08670 [Ignavibacteriales bacterium]|jgi:hypothetical protein|nr:hypothetical protein [Ignavibacteriales bacterium]
MFAKRMDILENIDEVNLSRELEIAKFRNYGREHFSDLLHDEISFDHFFQNTSKFYSINLPNEISDYLLRLDTAPFFWLSESPLIKKMEEILTTKNSKFNYVANFREIKKYYTQWITLKTSKEKQYYAFSISNQIERNISYQSFYNLIIYGVILTFDKNAYNPNRAIELYDQAFSIVSNCDMDSSLKKNLLYYVKVFKGFVYLLEYNYKKARITFNEALDYNSHGVNSFYYIALCSKYLDDFDTAFDGLKNVLEFDRMRFQYAINYNFLKLFSFFYNNACFYNVFTELGFAQMLPDIDFLLRSLFSSDSNSMDITYGKLINLDNLRIKEFFNQEVYSEIEFLRKALANYKNKRNGLIRIVEQIFRDKLVTLIEYIRNLIESHYFDQIKDDIIVFDKQIEQNKRQLELIKHERDDAFKKVKITEKEAFNLLDETSLEHQKAIEEKIKNIDEGTKFDPIKVFYSSMIFTSAISFLIFIVVGFMSVIIGSGEDDRSGLTLLIVNGFRWGGITFIIGIAISVFTAFSSYWEKGTHKKKLIAQLDYLKSAQSGEKKNLEIDTQMKSKVYEQKFRERISAQEKIIDSFIEERELNYKYKFNVAKKEIDQYITPLNELLNSLENVG